jgi:hypothetical protein
VKAGGKQRLKVKPIITPIVLPYIFIAWCLTTHRNKIYFSITHSHDDYYYYYYCKSRR